MTVLRKAFREFICVFLRKGFLFENSFPILRLQSLWLFYWILIDLF